MNFATCLTEGYLTGATAKTRPHHSVHPVETILAGGGLGSYLCVFASLREIPLFGKEKVKER